ncbi:alpha/beta hydrolase [Legionella septentrionalis]|uniref:alpha/beta hydrolase n=1 Tax=Legionella septentrionalis TaxID=2498109 RepID=UPI002D78880C|nr:alpha/beta hydrolase [Legionella septentrionalis]
MARNQRGVQEGCFTPKTHSLLNIAAYANLFNKFCCEFSMHILLVIKQVIITSCMILGLSLLFLYLWQRHLIYLPARTKPHPQDFRAQDMHVVTLKTEDGLFLQSWYKPAPRNNPTILYFHGNAGHIGYRMPLVRQFISAGFGVLLLEYRGYGGNAGTLSENNLYKDGRAGVKFLLQEKIPLSRIVFYGESLGSGVAVQMAVEYHVCALLLQSPFTSLSDVARHHYPWFPIKLWDRFESLQKIKNLHMPLLILHGKQDQIVPFMQAKSLFKAANQPKHLAAFMHRGHNDLWGANTFAATIIDFIRTHCC